MRADRLLTILLQLDTERPVTTQALARRLEVSTRTIARDMDALSAAGVPVVAERGARGGWRLAAPYRTDLTGLTTAELLAVLVPRPAGLLADLGLSREAEGALSKLLAGLPGASRQDAEAFQARLHIDASAWREPQETVQAFSTLQEAVWQGRHLQLRYRRGDGEEVTRTIAPLGLVAKGQTWYLVAECEGELRSYRAGRVLEANLLDTPVVRPEGFDLARYWAESTAAFVANLPRFELFGRVAPELQARLSWAGRFSKLESLEPEPDGWARVRVRVQSFEEAVEYALAFGPRFEVLAPLEVREAVIRQAEATLAFYAEHTPNEIISGISPI